MIGCAGDDLHPVEVAERARRRAARRQPCTSTTSPGVLWTDRADLRERISTFLNP